MSKRLC